MEFLVVCVCRVRFIVEYSFKYGTRLFGCMQNDTYLFGTRLCVMVKFLEERNSLFSSDCKTSFATKILDPSSVALVKLLTRAQQKS